MEEMNKEIVENTATEMVEVYTDKLTFRENVMAYGVAAVFVVGLVTTGYLGYKGGKALAKKIKEKREKSDTTEDHEVMLEYAKDEYIPDEE